MPTPSVPGSRLVFVSVKSFGDLIIAVTCLARISPDARHRVTLLIGEHLSPLASVLTILVEVRVLDERLDGPAPLFDARRLGIGAAVSSALSLRRAIGRAVAPGETLVFDTIGLRERFLAFGRRALALPPAANIYAAYEALFSKNGLPMQAIGPAVPTPVEGGLVRIFAGARMAHRRPPASLLHRAVQRVEAKGGRAEIMLLDGERPDLEGERLPVVVVPRDFGAMLDVMRRSDAVISPDSMTAHLAEYCSKPVLVLTPADKFYWMPRFAAETGAIALFDDDPAQGPFDTFLTRYLAA
jgi:hypothetical protein